MTRFLLFADAHYTTKPLTLDRRHPLSIPKLRDAITRSGDGCAFLVNLGDTTDVGEGYLPQEDCLREMENCMSTFHGPHYSVIGNHDTGIPKETVVKLQRLPGRYYSVDTPEFTCLFLDASVNDPKDPWTEKLIDWENCWIDDEQMLWLKETVEKTVKPLLVFCHPCFSLKEGWGEELHLIKNREEILRLFRDSGKVAAVFCGHYHPGDARTWEGIPIITPSALCTGEDTAYCVVTCDDSSVIVEGFGRQSSCWFCRGDKWRAIC